MWTLADIRTKTRNLTARPSTSQLSDADLDDYINTYYLYKFPQEVRPNELRTWFTATTVNGQGAYGFDSDMILVASPITVDGTEINLWGPFDAQRFFSIYPRDDEGTSTYSQPYDALWYNRELYLRPIPNDEYTIKASVYKRPTAFSDTTDTPTDLAWGEIIAYGAAIDIFLDASQGEEAIEIGKVYKGLISNLSTKNTMSLGEQIIYPSF